MSLPDLIASNRLANIDSVAHVTEAQLTEGGGAGMRVIDVAVMHGISLRIYPDRGLDLGQAWFAGVPLAWISQVGEAGPLRYLDGRQWSTAFMGGLMTTCGLRNVGLPSEGHGLHGSYSHLAARDVNAVRAVAADSVAIEVTGVVVDAAQPGPLRHARRIVVYAGHGRIEIEDTTTNLGEAAAATPLLYHFNFGAPLWAPPAQLEIPAIDTSARDTPSAAALGSWQEPGPLEATEERVLEHDLGDSPEGRATITNPDLGLTITLTWDRTTLPRLNQWLDPNPGMAVLGIEPANCSTRGRAFERNAGSLPQLEPGGTRTTTFAVTARADSSVSDQ